MLNNLLLILQLLVLHFPIMKYWGICPNQPIALICADFSLASKIIHSISSSPLIVDNTNKVDIIGRKLKSMNHGGIFWLHPNRPCLHSSVVEDKIEFLINAMNFGAIEDKKLTSPIFLVFNKVLPEHLNGRVFQIYIERNFKDIPIIPFEVFSEKHLELVKDKLEEHQMDDAFALKAAVTFLYPHLKYHNNLDLYRDLLNTCDVMASSSIEYSYTEGISIAVVEELIHHMKNEDLLIQEKDLQVDSPSSFDNTVFANENSLFISEKVFKYSISNITQTYPIDMVKQVLYDAGYLICKPNNYTKKVSFLVNGTRTYRHMIELNLSLMPKLKSYIFE